MITLIARLHLSLTIGECFQWPSSVSDGVEPVQRVLAARAIPLLDFGSGLVEPIILEVGESSGQYFVRIEECDRSFVAWRLEVDESVFPILESDERLSLWNEESIRRDALLTLILSASHKVNVAPTDHNRRTSGYLAGLKTSKTLNLESEPREAD